MKKHRQKSFLAVITLILVIVSPSMGQFKMDVQRQNIRDSVFGRPETPSLFDPGRFQMSHNFSMSVLNMGGTPISVGAYTNSFSFALSQNLILNSQISLVQPSMKGINNQGQIYYNVGLDYQMSENSYFSFKINNQPTYYQRSNQYFYLRGH